MDLHNLDREELTSASDARTEYRGSKVTIEEVDLSDGAKMKGNPEVEDLAGKIEKIQIESEEYRCIDCGGGFKSKGVY